MAAAVLLPASLVALHAEGLLFAEADGAEAIGGNAQRNEVLLHGASATVAQAKVIFRGAALVAMTFDGDLEARIVFQEVGSLGKGRASIRANVSLVIVEISIAHFSREEFVVRRPFGLLHRRRRSVHRDGCSGAGGAAGATSSNRVGRRVGWRNLGRALSSDVAHFGSDAELRGIGRIPAQGRRLTFVDGGRAGLQRHRGTASRGRGHSQPGQGDEGLCATVKEGERGGVALHAAATEGVA